MKRRGFSLIEAAIVLGIVGLVIGGIWTAASAVQARLRVSRALDFVTALHQTALTFKKTTQTGTGYSLGQVMRNPPGGYIWDSTNGYFTGGGQIWLTYVMFTDAPGTPNYGPFLTFYIYFSATPDDIMMSDPASMKVQKDLCLELSKRFASAKLGPHPEWADATEFSITWFDNLSGDAWDALATPPTIANLVNYCSDAKYMRVHWQF